ncbi:unnamed protein product, partial [Sphagnum balticum]
MAAIEVITSQERDVIVTSKTTGEKQIISVRVWNETVSNLTLMALGSSAPEILLSIIEIYSLNFEAGDLGPSTIVGSAAFNMFVIIAICVWSVPEKAKRIKHLRVFCVTVVFSVLAYIWLLFILVYSSPGIITVTESLLTFLFFPITVLMAFIADRRLLLYKYLSKHYRVGRGGLTTSNGVDGHVGSGSPDDVEMANGGDTPKVNGVALVGNIKNIPLIDASNSDLREFETDREECIAILKQLRSKHPDASNDELEELARHEVIRMKPKSRAFYRMQLSHKLIGAGKRLKHHFRQAIIDDFQEEKEDLVKDGEEIIKIYFNPASYTIMEDVGKVSVTVSRDGADLNSTIICDYITEDGTAKKDQDYKPVAGEITFGPGEAHKQITIEVINDELYEEDEYFFVRIFAPRYLNPQSEKEGKRPEIVIQEPVQAKIIILDDDHSGVFSFKSPSVVVTESSGDAKISVSRFIGARGRVTVPYNTISGSAKDGTDFVSSSGKLVFENNESSKDISIRIIDNEAYEKNVTFSLELGEPIRESKPNLKSGKTSSKDPNAGAPKLGEVTSCLVRIRESKEFKETVNKLIKRARTVSAISSTSWEEQFIDAVKVPRYEATPDKDDDVDQDVEVRVETGEKSILAYVAHYLTLFWKILFAFVPPPTLYNGWACFIVSIIVIGLLTALIGDLASHFGCSIGLKDSVTAISIVALGTSVPDTFASKIAAQNDVFADSSVGNVTGSNAVNVFLGIGVAWLWASVYHAIKGTEFRVDPGSLGFSVTIFCIFAFICSAVLLLRRNKIVGGELGGPMKFKLPTTILFVSLWLLYVLLSSLEAYGVIK